MRFFYLSIFVILFCKSGFSSVYLYNDSPFILKAVVIAANGANMGEKLLKPQELHYLEDQIGISDPVGGGDIKPFKNYSNSLTPYTVFWRCQDDSLYSSCSDTAAGATCMATSCPGGHYCKPPKEEKTQKDKDSYEEE